MLSTLLPYSVHVSQDRFKFLRILSSKTKRILRLEGANGAIEQIFRTIKRVSGGHWSLMREIQKGFKLEGRYSNSLNGI